MYGGKVVGARRITLRLEIGNCAEATVMDEADIWRSAKALIDSYGADASIHAAMRADKLLAQGDLARIIDGRLEFVGERRLTC